MLKTKWLWVLGAAMLLAFSNAVLLTYIHHFVNIMQPDICPLCASKYSFLDGTRVAESTHAYLFAIPVPSLAIFACLFVIIVLGVAYYLQKEALPDYLAFTYPILVIMLGVGIFQLCVSLFVIKALCIYCALLAICIIVATIACKRAFPGVSKDIFQRLRDLWVSLIHLKNRFAVTLVIAAFVIASLFAYSADSHFRYQFAVKNAKKIDAQKDRVIVLLKEMIH